VQVTLADLDQPAGRHVAVWDGTGPRERPAPGLYFVRLVAPDRVTVRKLSITR
jgi:hypothetical protein